MAIPSPDEARRILAARKPAPGIVHHVEGVARVAGEAARLLAASGIPIDVGLVEAAAVLHDLDKVEPGDATLPHGAQAGRLLAEMGFGELAVPVASHPVTALLDEALYPRGWASVVLAIADRHVAQEFLTIDQRLDDMQRRHPAYRASIEAARRPSHALERELAQTCGLSEEALVDRLRAAWGANAT